MRGVFFTLAICCLAPVFASEKSRFIAAKFSDKSDLEGVAMSMQEHSSFDVSSLSRIGLSYAFGDAESAEHACAEISHESLLVMVSGSGADWSCSIAMYGMLTAETLMVIREAMDAAPAMEDAENRGWIIMREVTN